MTSNCRSDSFDSPYSGQFSVQTSTVPNRSHGSGTWEIKIANATNIGQSIKDGDKIHLINQWKYQSIPVL